MLNISVMAEKIAEWKEKQAAIASGEITQDEVEMEDEPLYKPDTEVGLCSLSHEIFRSCFI
jgi:hypothetical protein